MKNQHIRKVHGPLSIVAAAAALYCLAGGLPVQAQQRGAGAQAAAEERTAEAVVVTASRREQALRTAPATMTVITRQEIESKPYGSVTELLRSVEGVSIVGANPNEQDISLRGLPGEYTLILVDGRRQNTRETMNRGTGGVQANLLPPLAAIERVEIVRGPMSSLYGADAMGGVVNIITRKLPKEWRGAVTARGTWQHEDQQGDSRALEFWVGGPLLDEQLGLQVSGLTRRRDEDDLYYPGSATSGANGQRDGRIDLKLSSRLTARQELSLDLGRQDFSYITTPGQSIADTPTATTVLKTRHEREHWGLSHQGRWDWGRSTVSLYSETARQTQWVPAGISAVEPEVRNTTLDGRVVVPWGGDSNTLTAGAQLSRQRLSGVAAQDAVPTGYARNADLLQRDAWALFAENDYAVTPAFTLTTGARLDHDEYYGSHLSPRVYGVYALDDRWTLRGGVATGFKAPTLRQSTGGYCMTTGGAAGAVAGTLCGNPALEPETSVAQEIGVRHDAGADFFSATLFNNAFKNKVASYDTGVADPASPGRNVYIYDNIARVNLRGLELAAGHDLGSALRLSGNYTYTDSKRRGGGENAFNGSSLDGRPLDKTPKHKLYLEATWKALPGLDLYTAAQFTSRQYWAAFRNGALGVRERAGATTYDLGARYAITRGVDLKVALLNLTNKMVPVDERARAAGLSGNWMVDEGRRLNVALNAQF